MNQANQQVVIQNANMTLIQIRQYEIGYFQTFFSNFGTQAALMIGFIAGSLSQVPGWDNPPGAPYFFVVLYWVTSALCLCAGMHCLVCTVFVNVYGQGLALRGPPGSMVRAIKGMIAEQQQILIAFCVAIFSFGLQCVGMYYIMMDGTSALITSIITVVVMIGWYRYALRLYNRFSWSGIDVDWTDKEGDRNPTEALDELNPTVVNDLHAKASKYQESNKKSMKDFQESSKKRVSVKGGTENKSNSSGKGGVQEISDQISVEELSAQNSEDIQSVVSASQQELLEVTKGMTFGSYLTLKERGRLGGEKWVRRYFVIKAQHIFYYQDKRSFELNADKPINKRAIDLEGYTLVAGSNEPPYPISLVPFDPEDIRKVWRFRCDTAGEFERWIQLFSVALQSCNPGKTKKELILIGEGKMEGSTMATTVRGETAMQYYSSQDER